MRDPAQLVKAYRRRGVLVDTNLLLLLFLGSYQRKYIGGNSRLGTFTATDFELLVRLLSQFRTIITTPNVLTEVSNLSNVIPEHERKSYFDLFARRVEVLKEEYLSSREALASRWAKFGLTDAVIAEIAKKKYLVLTDDFRLSQALRSDGIDTINFNHIRDIYWHSIS